jgi:hypothetical protein
MKKNISIFIALFLPAVLFAQISKYQGKYHATSLAIFGAEKMKSDFEVKADGTINGNFIIGQKDEVVLQNLQGKTNDKGKFEAQITQADGTVLSIMGNLPLEKQKGMVSFVQKKVIKGNGSKNISESGATGFIIRLSEAESAPEMEIEDIGKTHLIFGNTNILFSNEWLPVTTTFSITSPSNNTFKVIEIKDESGDSIRQFRLAVPEQLGKKIWLADEEVRFSVSYREEKGTEKNTFMYKQSGKIELISEDENEIIFKISNLQLKQISGKNVVRIDGYLHATKTQ